MSTHHVGDRGIAPAIDLSDLPRVATLQITLSAHSAVRLPPLVTTAIHGAFGHAMLRHACAPAVAGRAHRCRSERACLYARVCEPPGSGTAATGTTRAPVPVVLSPVSFDPAARRVDLDPGVPLAVRVTLIGGDAISHERQVTDALIDAATRGFGVGPAGSEGTRVPMRIDRIERVEHVDAGPMAMTGRVRVRFVTPMRIAREGHIQRHFDAGLLWEAAVRRASALSSLYGSGPLLEVPVASAPFRLVSSDTRVVGVRRWSSRQAQRMTWPGVFGSLSLDATDDPMAWSLMRFAERVQIGKGTSFGFGAFVLCADPPQG